MALKKDQPNSEAEENGILFDARNFYYIGNFMNCINTILPEQTTGTPELLAYSYLSYLAIQSGRLINSEIDSDNKTALVAFRYLYDYFENPEKREEIVSFFQEKLQQDVGETNIWQIAAAIIFDHEEMHEETLRALQGSNDLECMAMTIQALLKMNRVDLAKPILAKMQEKSDDATLTQMAQAWVGICSGGDGLQEAFHIYQEFCEKYPPTPLLLNGQAVCHITQERYEEADAILKEALAKKHNDLDTLINLIVLSHLTGKSSEILTRYIEQIRQFYPECDFIKDLDKKSEEFDRLCTFYKPEINV
ncbi:coatomer subunit epsilon [Condylostylus longicornis]|uniref:coatomer subunit epsilon n=1 Tax=Condylostylus longicornis TaxID=2530218 RepID=UPI00244DB827|nr:coatomer subunit epsilon [Condylostylus longicornis]